MNQQPEDLRGCPFCLGLATLEKIEDGCYGVGCSDCDFQLMNGSVGIGWHESEQEAITAWNERGGDLAMSQLQAWVKELQAENVALKISAPSQCLLQIQEPAVKQQLEATPAFYTAIAAPDGKWIPLPEYSAQTSDGVLRRVLERAHQEGYQGGNALERLKELGWAYRPVYFAADPAQAAPAAVAVPDEREAFEKWAALHYQGAKLERSGAGYRYALANEWWPAWQARAALAATPAADAKDSNPFLSDEDLNDLLRFEGMASDGEGYDISKKRMKRLAELGVVRWMGGSRYSMTAFGQYVLKSWDRLPLETYEEANARVGAEFRTRIDRLNAEAIAAQAAQGGE